MTDWKEKAVQLYFKEHLRICEIAGKVGKSRQSVSALLKSSDLFEGEHIYRKNQSEKRRKKQKLAWDRENKSAGSRSSDGIDIVYEGVKSEHYAAVAELSAERY